MCVIANNLSLAPGHVITRRSGEMEIVRNFPESLQDHSVFELSEIRISSPRERYRTSNSLTAGHRLRPPDRSGFMRTFDRFTGRQTAVNLHKRQRHVVDHDRPPTLDALPAI
jgi:hypothetical protein